MRASVSIALLGAALAAPSFGQSLVLAVEGDSAGDQLGVSVGGAGDVDGDGVDDVLSVAPSGGYRRARSGATHAAIRTWTFAAGGAGFRLSDALSAVFCS